MYRLYDYQKSTVKEVRRQLFLKNKGVLIVIPPGGGKSVVIAEIARMATAKGNRVMFTVHRRELIKQIKQSFAKQNVDLSLCTIMTVRKIFNRLGKLPKPDLIIVDETQHARAKTYREIFDYYAGVPRLGFTGSPWRLSGKGFKDIYSAMVQGPTTESLIKQGKLAPYTLFGYSLGDQSVLKKSATGDYTSSSMDKFGQSFIHGDVIKSWQKFAKDRKTIVYCHSVAFSKEIAQEFQKAGISAAEADAKTPLKDRDQIMNEFRQGKIKVLCNYDLYGEGVNVPDCSCVVLLRPTESLVIYLQQAMRCMRYQPHKTAVIIDQVDNFKRFGLPDRKFNWSLDDRKKTRKSNNTAGPPIRTCPHCFAVVSASYNKCPICNHEFKAQSQAIKQDKDQKLHRITKIHLNYLVTKKPSELKNIQELREYGKLKGYKRGWAWYQAKRRHWI